MAEVNMSKITDLQVARDRIARGWCQYALKDDAGRVCIMGALMNTDSLLYGVMHHLVPDLHRQIPSQFMSKKLNWEGCDLVDFNNHPSTKQQDVLDLFDRAIRAARGLDVRLVPDWEKLSTPAQTMETEPA